MNKTTYTPSLKWALRQIGYGTAARAKIANF